MHHPRNRSAVPRRVRFLRIAATMAIALAFGLAHAQALAIDDVDELLAAFAAGGTYDIAPGTYRVPVPLVANGEVTIVGSGRDAVLLELAGGPIAVHVGEGASLHLEGMRLVWVGEGPADVIVVRNGSVSLRGVDLGQAVAGSSATPDPWRPQGHGSALTLQGASTAMADEVVISRNGGNTIEVLDDSTLSLVDALVIDNFRGLVASDRARVVVEGGAFRDQRAQGVALTNEAQADFDGTAFDGNGMRDVGAERFLEAIRVAENARASFTGGVLRDSPTTGLRVSGSAVVVVRGMRFEANGGVLDGNTRSWPALGATGQSQVTVVDSSVTGSPAGAFAVRQSASLALENVEVTGVGGFAHTAVADEGRLMVQGGRFIGNAGVLFVGGEARGAVYDSELRDGATLGVLIMGTAGVEIVGTLVAGYAGHGVRVDGGASVDVTGGSIEGNEVGVWLTGEAAAFLTDVRVAGNLHSGVVLGGTARAVVETSEVSGHASNGVAAMDESAVIVRDSVLNANAVNGVLVGGTATATLERNVIGGGESGVRLESEGTAQGGGNTFADNGMDVREVR